MALFTDNLEEILKYYEKQAGYYKLLIESAPKGKLYL